MGSFHSKFLPPPFDSLAQRIFPGYSFENSSHYRNPF